MASFPASPPRTTRTAATAYNSRLFHSGQLETSAAPKRDLYPRAVVVHFMWGGTRSFSNRIYGLRAIRRRARENASIAVPLEDVKLAQG